MDKTEFLKTFDFKEEYFDSSELDYKTLLNIYHDFKESIGDFEQVATLLANTIQKYKYVHSVRWRVKDAKGLIKKIVRKATQGKTKYKDISVDNYTEVITDLVGIRVLHLFKKEWVHVCNFIDGKWKGEKEKIAYYKHGDSEELIESYRKAGYETEKHGAGYRSIHLVFGINVFGYPAPVEVQVRTIFEEAWSEMDHQLRYPDHNDDETLMAWIDTVNTHATGGDIAAENARDYLNRKKVELEQSRLEHQYMWSQEFEEKEPESLCQDKSESETEELEPRQEPVEIECENNPNDEVESPASIDGIERAHLAWLDDQERYKDSIEKLSMAALYSDSPYESLAKKVADQWKALEVSKVESLSSYQEDKLHEWMGKLTSEIDHKAMLDIVNPGIDYDAFSGAIKRLDYEADFTRPTILDDLKEGQKRIDDMLKVKGFNIENDDES